MSAECRNTISLLSAYRDGELTPSQKGAVEAHLAGCDGCGARLADMQALGGLLRLRADALGEQLPADFAAQVMAALPPEREPWFAKLFARRRALLIGLCAAAAAVAAVVVPLALQPPGGRDRSAAENEAHVHRLEVSNSGSTPLVFQDDLGETVIWVVPDPGAAHAPAGQEAPAGAHP